MPSNKIVLFDFDGVIVDTFEMLVKLHGREYPEITKEIYRGFFDGNLFENIAAWEKEHVAAEKLDFFAEYAPLLMKHEPVKGMKNILHTLAGKHPLIIVSSTIESPIEDYLSKNDFSKYFAEVLGRNTEKSKTKKIQDVMRRYNIKADDVVFITDTLSDLKEANEVGVKTVAVTWGVHEKERLQKGAPNAIVQDPAKLLETIEGLLA